MELERQCVSPVCDAQVSSPQGTRNPEDCTAHCAKPSYDIYIYCIFNTKYLALLLYWYISTLSFFLHERRKNYDSPETQQFSVLLFDEGIRQRRKCAYYMHTRTQYIHSERRNAHTSAGTYIHRTCFVFLFFLGGGGG